MDTRIGLRFDHVDPTGFVYYKPVAPDASKGSSMRLTETLVREYFHEMRLEGSRLTLVVGHEQKPPPEARIQLRFDHVNPRGCVYYKPADPDVRKGSLHLTPTLVRQHFRGLRPESFWLALVMAATEFKISEEPLAERVLRQVRSGTVDEARLLPSGREAGAGRGQEARPARGAAGLVHLHGRPGVRRGHRETGREAERRDHGGGAGSALAVGGVAVSRPTGWRSSTS